MEIAKHTQQYMKQYLQIQLNLKKKSIFKEGQVDHWNPQRKLSLWSSYSKFPIQTAGQGSISAAARFPFSKGGGKGQGSMEIGENDSQIFKRIHSCVEIVKHNIIALQKKSLHYFLAFLPQWPPHRLPFVKGWLENFAVLASYHLRFLRKVLTSTWGQFRLISPTVRGCFGI